MILVFASLCDGTAASAFTTIGTVTVQQLNVRARPTANSKRIGLLFRGATVEIIDRQGAFIKLRYGAKVGFVRAEYVRERAQNPNLRSSETRIGDSHVARFRGLVILACRFVSQIFTMRRLYVALASITLSAIVWALWFRTKRAVSQPLAARRWVREATALVKRIVNSAVVHFLSYCLVLTLVVGFVAGMVQLYINPHLALPQSLLLGLLLMLGISMVLVSRGKT
jgi:Bacterial SH3 domain